MEKEPMNFEQEDTNEYEDFTGPLEEALEKKKRLVAVLSEREFYEIKRLEKETESIFDKYHRSEVKNIEARYSRVKSALLEKIHKMELAYRNSAEYIDSNQSNHDQKFFQDAANWIDSLLEEMKDVHDEDVLRVCDYDNGRESSWENISAKDFRERMLKLKNSYLTKPGEYTSEDINMLNQYGGYSVQEWKVSESNEEEELGYDYSFDEEEPTEW